MAEPGDGSKHEGEAGTLVDWIGGNSATCRQDGKCEGEAAAGLALDRLAAELRDRLTADECRRLADLLIGELDRGSR